MDHAHALPARRRLLAAAALLLAAPVTRAAAGPSVTVWRNPDCGCCHDWVKHLQDHGFVVQVQEVPDTAVPRQRLRVPAALGSCHTAWVGGYALEGHVSAREVQRLLREKPDAVGLAVPGMPVGSPGMDGPAYGGRRDPFDVLLIARDGRSSVYQRYR